MKLAKREKYIVNAGVFIVIAFLVLQFVVEPFFKEKKQLVKDTISKEKDLGEITMLSSEYQTLKNNYKGMEKIFSKRKEGFNLFSFLEKAGGDAGIKDNIKSMKPSVSSGAGSYKESIVEMKLEDIQLKQLADYLYLIEQPENGIVIKRIAITEQQKKSGYLDAVLTVLTVIQE